MSGRKRKTSPSPPLPNNHEPTTASEGSTASRPEVTLRRSTRRLTVKDANHDEQSKVAGSTSSGPAPMTNAEDMDDSRVSAQERRALAIEGLVKIERRTKLATKKQNQQVAESRLPRAPDRYAIPRPNARSARKDDSPRVDGPPAKRQRSRDKTTATATATASVTQQSPPAQEPQHLLQNPDDFDALDAPERGAARAPVVNSSYLPLPWRGRLGYACLNTYLRTAKPVVFSSRTCRMSSIIDHRHPLQHPDRPEHPTKNRPDKSKPASLELGYKFVEELGLANARDIIKMLRWNDKYGIRLFRLSSEMFPFASHPEHGYKLAPFASDVLAEAGKVAAELGHRLTMHPGQFTQLGSPRREVITASIRDLEYHNELLSLLRLPPQQDRDAVLILHMGGVYGDKAAALARFRTNYTTLLSPSIKARLVLENDDVSWSVHELLPTCEELDIPLVLDYHHHNIVFDASQCREGTLDISRPAIMERIAATWRRKGITQKMHYSEPCPGAVTPKDRRKHSPRVATLPPCPPDMDLMIEAKDKEQAVFELMRNFKLPGFERVCDMVPYEREDEVRAVVKAKGKKKGKRKMEEEEEDGDGEENGESIVDGEIAEEDFAMGGRGNRVYWPPGCEEWLKPKKKKEVVKKGRVGAGDDDDDDDDDMEF
ncbi:UV-endonuclease UvdE-domain-containing protein [Podospora appendiculata]|uniref:UV-endonuclease UvdE-domain-containing protein n=1 Tax=Podospora appendiculata TaxID=314037 RepID=A0AAE1CB37_9PEZI|nr:UV-endonuclease UvdE-domain-containing protein [Podospora appendiculata]